MIDLRHRLFAFTLAFAGACGTNAKQDAQRAATQPEPIGVAECAACGMVVREQPAPRAQVVHNDGTRAYFCSIGDLAHYLQAPSPHGRAIGVFVEVAEATTTDAFVDPDLNQAPWVAADDATFLVGIDRPNIMGAPALTFGTRAQAELALAQLGGELMNWETAKAHLVGQPPEASHDH